MMSHEHAPQNGLGTRADSAGGFEDDEHKHDESHATGPHFEDEVTEVIEERSGQEVLSIRIQYPVARSHCDKT